MELRSGDGDGTRFAVTLGSAANGLDLIVSRFSETGGAERSIAESREVVGASGGRFSIILDRFCSALGLAVGGECFPSSTSIWNTEVMPLDVRMGLGDLMGKSLLGLITIGSGLFPYA